MAKKIEELDETGLIDPVKVVAKINEIIRDLNERVRVVIA